MSTESPLYHFLSGWRTSFACSFWGGLRVINPHLRMFYFPFTLNGNLTSYRIQNWQFVSVQHLKNVVTFLLPSQFLRRSPLSFAWLSFCRWGGTSVSLRSLLCHFFPLSCVVMRLGVDFFGLVLFGIHWVSWLCRVMTFAQFGEMSTIFLE